MDTELLQNSMPVRNLKIQHTPYQLSNGTQAAFISFLSSDCVKDVAQIVTDELLP
jgi:hypothetical protein